MSASAIADVTAEDSEVQAAVSAYAAAKAEIPHCSEFSDERKIVGLDLNWMLTSIWVVVFFHVSIFVSSDKIGSVSLHSP